MCCLHVQTEFEVHRIKKRCSSPKSMSMISASDHKHRIRQEVKLWRSTLPSKHCAHASQLICSRLFALDAVRNAQTIMIYFATDTEVELTCLIEKLLQDNKTLLAPVVRSNYIIACHLSSKRTRNVFGIEEPANAIPFEGTIDVVLVPGLRFGVHGERIGYGKGYYDRFLTTTRAYRIGVVMHKQLKEKVPQIAQDVPMHAVITEQTCIRYL